MKLFVHENASENIICEVVAILSSGDELTNKPWLVQLMTWCQTGDIIYTNDCLVYWCMNASFCLDELNTLTRTTLFATTPFLCWFTDKNCYYGQASLLWIFDRKIIVLQEIWLNNIDGLVQDCSNSIANAMELLQSCTKPAICCLQFLRWPGRWGRGCSRVWRRCLTSPAGTYYNPAWSPRTEIHTEETD